MDREQTKEEEKEEGKKEEDKEQVIPDWEKIDNDAFKRIRERVNNYVNNGWYNRVNKKPITMNLVKKIFKNIVSGEFDNTKEAYKFYADNVYEDEQKIRSLSNRADRNKDMIHVYDQV